MTAGLTPPAKAQVRPEPGQRQVGGYSWYALCVLTIVYMFNFIDRQILSILANDIKADLGLSDADLGFLYGTAFAIFYALFGIPLGRLADSWHRVRLLGLGVALWSVMTVLSGFAKGALTLTAARIGVGVGEASCSPAAYSLIGDMFPRRLRATALAIYSSGIYFGIGLSLVIGAAIVERWNNFFPGGGPWGLVGWQAAFIAVGAPGILLALWVLSLREPQRGSGGASENSSPARDFFCELADTLPPLTLISAARRGRHQLLANLLGLAGITMAAAALVMLTGAVEQWVFLGFGCYAVFSWASAIRIRDPQTFNLTWGSPAFLCIVLGYGCVCVIGYSVSYWAAPFAERELGVSKEDIGWLIGAPQALAGFLGVIGGGRAADWLQTRFANGRIRMVIFGLLAPLPMIILAYGSVQADVFFVLSFLIQLTISSALGAAAAASQMLVLPRMRGLATAIFFLGTTLIGLGLGPFCAGFVSSLNGDDLGLGVQYTVLAALPGIVLLGAALVRAPIEASRLERSEIAAQ